MICRCDLATIDELKFAARKFHFNADFDKGSHFYEISQLRAAMVWRSLPKLSE
jgi:hypothetical protein